MWGRGKEGQLGMGNEENQLSKPTQLIIEDAEKRLVQISSIHCGPIQSAIITGFFSLFKSILLTKFFNSY